MMYTAHNISATASIPANIGQFAVSPPDVQVVEKSGFDSLGNYTKSCNPPPDYIPRYRLQNAAAALLPDERVNHCCKTLIKDATTVNVLQHESGSLSYGNLVRCGSVWTCPVCAAKIVVHRRQELSDLLDNAVNAGFYVTMVTLTIPHGIDDALTTTLDTLSRAKRLMQNRKPYKRLAADIGLIGEVRTLETTHGKNGWHPHFHVLLFSKNKMSIKQNDPNSDVSKLLVMWKSACVSVGWKEPNEHGVDVRQCQKSIKDYVLKFGIDYEMTYSNNKMDKGRSPFQILDDAANGDKQSSAQFVEYAAAFKGKRQLVYSKGLKAMFQLNESLSDTEVIEKPEPAKVVYTLTRERWKLILKHNQRAEFLKHLHEKLIMLRLSEELAKVRQE